MTSCVSQKFLTESKLRKEKLIPVRRKGLRRRRRAGPIGEGKPQNASILQQQRSILAILRSRSKREMRAKRSTVYWENSLRKVGMGKSLHRQ